jgi:hypothetical protein
MRTASILLVLIVVMGCVRDVWAFSDVPEKIYTVDVSGHRFGFIDTVFYGLTENYYKGTYIYLGPLGTHHIPITATQGLVGFCVTAIGLIALPSVLIAKSWRRKAR